MAASINDKLTDVRNAARPNSARVSSPRTTGGATLVCDNLTGWPTASKVHFVTYKIDSSSNVVAGTQLDCYGIVSGNSITSFTVVDGTDVGHAVNDVVEMLPTAAWGQDLADGLNVQHNRSGTHKSITTDTIATTGNATVGGNETVAGTLAVTGATTLTGAIGGAGYSLATISNPYKSSAYASGTTTIAAGIGGSFGALTKIAFATELYDTGSNFDNATNYRFTAPIAGFYQVNTKVEAFVNNGILLQIELQKNGTTSVGLSPQVSNATGGNNNIAVAVNKQVQLAANDYLEVYARTNQTTTSNNTTGLDTTYFDVSLISAT